MPIDYRRYPADWKVRRARILDRANHRCESCDVPNHAVGCRDEAGRFVPVTGKPSDRAAGVGLTVTGERLRFGAACDLARELGANDRRNWLIIVLTVAHLDHDPDNHDVADDRLKALCQRCHLNYDRAARRERREIKVVAPEVAA